jgi:4-amino-4-deoxy-L-arabinose transferase-like glycosyltransferase
MCLILVAALVLNAAIVLIVLATAASPMAETYSMDFGDLYDLIAKSLDQGHGYRVDPAMSNTMLREPGYPLLLAAVFKAGGYGIQQARVICVLLAFGAALLLLRLTRKVTGDMTAALAAAILFLLYPGILVAEARAGIEIPSIFTVLIFMLVLHSAVESKRLWQYFVAGLMLGLAVMVRSEVLLFPSFLLLWLLITTKGWVEARKAVVSIAALVVGAVLVMSPWIVRNYLLVHEFVPTATVAGVAAQEGLFTCESSLPGEPFYAAQRRAGYERMNLATSLGKPFTGPYYQLFYTPKDEVAFNHALLNKVSTEYRSHPEILATCAAKNLFFNFWFLGKKEQSTILNVILQAPLLAVAIAGAVILWKRGLLRKAGIIVLYILYIPTLHAAIIAHSRHSMLVVPFLMILAAVCVVSAWRALTTRNASASSHQSIALSR